MGESAPVEGLRLGRYEVLRHLASGGMADLLLARTTGIEGFERHVVIKRIRGEAAKEPRFVKMFLDEARLAAALHHHNIVQVHDVGQEGGEYYFAMEYVHGEDLRRFLLHLARKKLKTPYEHVVAIVGAACAGLHHAHEQKGPDRKPLGIVHRDVSPANILVGYDGNVKVVDFGIAKAVAKTTETRTGVLKGKVAYMSPEQCLGEALDRRSDVYALGIVLYEASTVRRLFKGDNDYLTMSSIVEGKIPKPSELRPDIPPALEAIILKALSRERDDRYQTAEEMRLALDEYAQDAHLRSGPSSLADFMKREFGKRPNPWEVETPDLDVAPVDFDGSGGGVVEVSTKVLQDMSVPDEMDAASSAPIMRARKKALSVAPPVGEAANDASGTGTPMAWSPEPTVTKIRTSHLAGGAIGLIMVTALVVFLVVRPTGASDDTPQQPAAAPKTNVITVPVMTPQIIPTPVKPAPDPDVTIDPPDASNAVAPDAGVPEVKKPPHIHTPPPPPTNPGQGSGTKKWDPNKLFPK